MSNMTEILGEMLYSGDPLERNALYEGQSVHGDLPLCLPIPTFLLHGAIRGRTGAGKTLEVMRQITRLCLLQAPRRLDYLRRRGQEFEEYSIVCFCQKGDDALFNSNRVAASLAEMDFGALDPRVGEQSRVYNACRQLHHRFMSPDQQLQELMSALGLIYSAGSGYGQWYYTGVNGRFVGTAYEARDEKGRPRFRTIRELSRLLNSEAEFLSLPGATREMLRDGSHAATVAWFLSKVHPLNVTRRDLPGRSPVFRGAVDALSLFYRKRFLHVTVPWGDFPLIGPSIVNLLLLQIFNAGRYARRTRKYRVIVYLDEAQHALTEQAVKQFAQARDYGITIVLVHQQRDQLADIGGKDLRPLVDANTAWSIDFDASTADMIRWVQDHSPTGMRIHRSFERTVASIEDLNDPYEYGLPRAKETTDRITFSEHEGPIYSQGEILILNSSGNVGWLRVSVDRDHLRTVGVVPFYWKHHITEEQYRLLKRTPRPGPSPETITVKREPFRQRPGSVSLGSSIIRKPQEGE